MSEMATEVRIRPITVDEFERMGALGIIDPRERVELIDGELIAMPPEGPEHASAAARLARIFIRRLGDRVTVRMGNPLPLPPYSEPEPDLAVVAYDAMAYQHRHPSPSDALLAVEVGAATREFDRRRKAPLYAREGIPELWLVDVVDRQLVVLRKPEPAGYAECLVLSPGDRVAPFAFPDASFDVGYIVGAPAPGCDPDSL